MRAGGGLALLMDQRLLAFHPDEGVGETLARLPDLSPACRGNDCSCDSAGNLWLGVMDRRAERPLGGLYRIDPAGQVRQVDDGYVVANGPAITAAGDRLYVADSARRVIYALTVDADGRCLDKQPWVTFSAAEGYPDGMALDSLEHLWVAHYDGGRVSRYDPEGRLESSFTLPVARPTAPAFGDADVSTLYVTSARAGLASAALAAQPLAGGLFRYPVEVRGRLPGLFGG